MTWYRSVTLPPGNVCSEAAPPRRIDTYLRARHLAVVVLDAAALVAASALAAPEAHAAAAARLVLLGTGGEGDEGNQESSERTPEKAESVLAKMSVTAVSLELLLGNNVDGTGFTC